MKRRKRRDAREESYVTLKFAYVCQECAEKRGGTWPRDHRGAAHEGKCSYCSQTRMLTCVTDWQWENNPTPDGKWKWHCEACGTLTNDGECDCTKFIETMRLQRLVRYSNP